MKVPSMIETKVTSSLKGSVLSLIRKDYQFIAGEKIQDMFAGKGRIKDIHACLTGRHVTHGGHTAGAV